MKTSELTGAALDWAVAKCEQVTVLPKMRGGVHCTYQKGNLVLLAYSTDWAQGGPIIERETIAIYASGACSVAPKNPDYWVAEILDTAEMINQYGPTPLIAAMRAYVASKVGDKVEVPEELK